MLTVVPGGTRLPAATDWLSTLPSSLQSTLGRSVPRVRPADCSSPAASLSNWSNRSGTVTVTTGVHWIDTVFEVARMPAGGSVLGKSATYAMYTCVVASGWLTVAEQNVPEPQTGTTAPGVWSARVAPKRVGPTSRVEAAVIDAELPAGRLVGDAPRPSETQVTRTGADWLRMLGGGNVVPKPEM